MARVRPVLSCYGDPVLHVGPLGAGQKVKLVNNALFAAQIGLLAERRRVGCAARRDRVGAARRTSAWQRGEPGAGHRRGAAGRSASFIETAGEFVGKDVAVVRGIAAELGSDLGVLDDVIDAGVAGAR